MPDVEPTGAQPVDEKPERGQRDHTKTVDAMVAIEAADGLDYDQHCAGGEQDGVREPTERICTPEAEGVLAGRRSSDERRNAHREEQRDDVARLMNRIGQQRDRAERDRSDDLDDQQNGVGAGRHREIAARAMCVIVGHVVALRGQAGSGVFREMTLSSRIFF